MPLFAFACSFSRLLTGRLNVRAAVRTVSLSAARAQLHSVEGTGALTGKVDRFGGVTVNLGEIGLPADISEGSFSSLLQGETANSACDCNTILILHL